MKGLPDNLYAYKDKRSGITYYKYVRPDNKELFGMGKNKAEAVQAARILNNKLTSQTPASLQLANKVESQGLTLSEWVDDFQDRIMPQIKNKRGKKLSERTKKDYGYIFANIKRDLGYTPLAGLTLSDVTQFLNALPNRYSNSHRARFSLLLKYAVAEGKLPENLVEKTIPKPEERKRLRLTLEDYKAIFLHAKPVIQNAMALALHTLQRPEDLVNIQFKEHIETVERKGTEITKLKIKQSKTGKCLEIKLDAECVDIVKRSRADDIPSPYLLHIRPDQRMMETSKKAKVHWTKCTREYLSRGFAKARKAAGLHQKLDNNQMPPSFYEIVSLGTDLYRKQGWTTEQIQALKGHSDVATTEIYLSGHEHWSQVSAELIVNT